MPLDSVQEFRVTVGGQNANQGRSSGGQVTLVTKSGTNQLPRLGLRVQPRHGKFSANNWFSNRAGIPREQLKRNQYGVSLGGPIMRDRVFFFGNVERRKDNSAANQLRRCRRTRCARGTIMAQGERRPDLRARPGRAEGDRSAAASAPARRCCDFFSSLPAANDPSAGIDSGLNFAGYRFNAPLALDNRAYVAKVDVKLDSMSTHNLSRARARSPTTREDVALAQYPGQEPTARSC